jgi:DNA processing protein
MSDCTVVVESAQKGGALITANIADSYNRDIFAFPGKIGDKYSQGCNLLIKNKKAALVTSADDIFREMNWNNSPESKQTQAVQRILFPDLTPEEQKVMDILSKAGSMQLNLLAIELDLPVSRSQIGK